MRRSGQEFEGEYPRDVVASFDSKGLVRVHHELEELGQDYSVLNLPSELSILFGVSLREAKRLYYGARTISHLDGLEVTFSEVFRVYVRQVGLEPENLDFDLLLKSGISNIPKTLD